MTNLITVFQAMGRSAGLVLLVLGLVSVAAASGEKKQSTVSAPQRALPFQTGEVLRYDVTWSNFAKAGNAVMEVKQETTPDGREVLRFVVTFRTTGAVGKLYGLSETVQSVFDPQSMQSLSYNLVATRSKKTKRRELIFDHAQKTARVTINEDPPQTMDIPERVQDPLSALYYLRTKEDLAGDKAVAVEVFDGRKSRPAEIQFLGREKVKTPAGEFTTIKVKASEGMFMSEGELFLWLTDDRRKIPVLLKGKLSFGSAVFTLREMNPGPEPN